MNRLLLTTLAVLASATFAMSESGRDTGTMSAPSANECGPGCNLNPPMPNPNYGRNVGGEKHELSLRDAQREAERRARELADNLRRMEAR